MPLFPPGHPFQSQRAPLSHSHGPQGSASHSSLSYVCPFQGSSVTGNRTQGTKGSYFKESEQKNACACLVAAGGETNPQRLICGGKGERGPLRGGEGTGRGGKEKQTGLAGVLGTPRRPVMALGALSLRPPPSQMGLRGAGAAERAERCQGKFTCKQMAKGSSRQTPGPGFGGWGAGWWGGTASEPHILLCKMGG